MSTSLSALIAEDSEDDALLLVRELRRAGYSPVYERVETPEGMRAALQAHAWDVVIADYAMPSFGALAALEMLRASGLDLPFIVVSGTIGEEVAVALMRAGAHDYVMKSSLTRLGPAIQRELHEARMRRERRELEQNLERARRMEALGQLAGGVAHDLNNIVGPLVAYPELILEDLPQDSPVREDVMRIQEAAQRAAAVIQDLLTLARRGAYQMTPLSLNLVVEQYLRSPSLIELRARYPAVSVEASLASDLLSISGSAPHLSKVIMNLVSNAFEAMPSGGRIQISTFNQSMDHSYLGYDYIEAGSYAVLRVSDTGTGIAQDDIGRIFEPFFTRKAMGRSGSGLGLAVVYGVVHDHKGRMGIKTQMGAGTEFLVFFPVTTEPSPEATGVKDDYRGNETVLVVDDLEEQRQVAARLLGCLGYQVTAVDSGPAALRYLEAKSADVVLLDMIMADDWDGLDTFREIVRLYPSQKAIIVSGFSETDRVREALALGVGQFVKKPYTVDSIGRAVRWELDSHKS